MARPWVSSIELADGTVSKTFILYESAASLFSKIATLVACALIFTSKTFVGCPSEYTEQGACVLTLFVVKEWGVVSYFATLELVPDSSSF